MIKDDYVPFSIIPKLKELGFPFDCILIPKAGTEYYDEDLEWSEDLLSAVPLISLAVVQKWLREEKKIILTLEPEDDYGIEFLYVIRSINEQGFLDFIDSSNRGNMYSYEQALLEGIKKTLEDLL